MNSKSTVAETALRREKSGLGRMIKALAWEECRVGGVIAGWCLLVGLLCLAYCRAVLSEAAWNREPEFILLFVVGAPMLTALLLILNTDNSGHLVGGFSERILRLPVPVSAAVAVALVARTALVFISALVFKTVCDALFSAGPGMGAVYGITLLYLFVQTFDWLRKPVSGLSSLLIVAGVLAFIVFLGHDEWIKDLVQGLAGNVAALATVLCVAVIPVYGISVAAVHATRVGRSVGIPEFWEWPRYVSVPWLARSRPFATPLAAQVWFDLRRSWWVLPGVPALFCLLIAGALWFDMEPGEEPDILVRHMVSASAFVGLVFSAAMHGGYTGFLERNAKPQHQFMHPLTSAQFAFARIVSSAAVLVPLVLAVLVFQFALSGGRLVTEIIPDALAIGATSYREATWILLGRGLLAGLIAWPLMNAGNRTIAWMLLAEGVLVTVLVWLHLEEVLDWRFTRILPLIVVIGVTIGAYVSARKSGVISLRALAIAGGIWFLTTIVLLHVVLAATPSAGTQTLWHASSVVTCVCWAALIPLPYVAVALEVRRRRHAGSAPQDPAQHMGEDAALLTGPARTAARVGVACLVVFLLWLSWPARPVYEAYWRNKGYPATLAELDAWYKAVPAERNVASAYLELAQATENAWKTFYEPYLENPPGVEAFNDHLLIVGTAKFERGKPIAGADWEATETYWKNVTSTVAPELRGVAAEKTTGSRYPIDLRDGFAVDLPHLAQLRELARQLYLDSLHWTLAGDPATATDDVEAMIPIANSLSEEPLLISQLVRVAILGIAYANTEEMMSRSVLNDTDLVRLTRIFSSALPPVQDRMILDRAIIGEVVLGMYYVGSPGALIQSSLADTDALHVSSTAVLFWQLAAPAAGERLAMTRYCDELLTLSREPRDTYKQWADAADELLFEDTVIYSPITAVLRPPIAGTYGAEWRVRTQFDVARTAIAVERYRLANGRLPDALQDLAPAFLPEVPMDYFANGETPLRYRQLGSDSYVVYSIGKDGEDDRGEEIEQWWAEGDITFTVAPLAVRTGPQVAPG